MKRALIAAFYGLALMGQAPRPDPRPAPSHETPSVKMWRLDCGGGMINMLNVFSDIDAYTGQSQVASASCYLIKHGDIYMLWDTGLAVSFKGVPVNRTARLSFTLAKTLVEQLGELHLRPEQISIVGISHYHTDHTGQAGSFPDATLMIGKADFDALRASPPAADPAPLEHWLRGSGKIETVRGDKDVFGDGTVVMLDLPGHTPGHHGLLVRLAHMGNVLLTGDLAHFRQNYDTNGVPGFNTSRAETLASLDRFKQLARNLHATVIIQHDARDIAKLPAFPKAAD